jgi:hypothetical protein
MKLRNIITQFFRLTSVTALLAGVACGSGNENSSKTNQSVAAGADDACAESEDGADGKITCAVDADCDSDEYCSDGLCTGLDGEADDDAAADGEEEANDKIYCEVDSDCDSDEFCSDGLCTGLDGDTE